VENGDAVHASLGVKRGSLRWLGGGYGRYTGRLGDGCQEFAPGHIGFHLFASGFNHIVPEMVGGGVAG